MSYVYSLYFSNYNGLCNPVGSRLYPMSYGSTLLSRAPYFTTTPYTTAAGHRSLPPRHHTQYPSRGFHCLLRA
ncbi:hypothetical protein HYPBUDRAFT_151645, partial [Hyphopichia burtonii NRRL Y-1933]